MCVMKIAVWSVLSKDALGFTWRKQRSSSLRDRTEAPCMLLGHLANVRLLEPVTKGQVAKDLDTKYKHLVKGLCHVQLRVRSCPLYFCVHAFEEEPSFWNYQPSLSQMRMVFGSRCFCRYVFLFAGWYWYTLI
ncbi:hypothetical protein BDR07DRAFT_1446127 [Suillus spraguei]|nr:hypothetical protein BDR07DRAFT_1446127 [Suillus spraguei]